jgi:hypothetical protein
MIVQRNAPVPLWIQTVQNPLGSANLHEDHFNVVRRPTGHHFLNNAQWIRLGEGVHIRQITVDGKFEYEKFENQFKI